MALRRFGPYELDSELGRGGAGTAYLARDNRSNVALVVKILHQQYAADHDFVRRFRHEAEMARLLDSRFVALVLDAGVIEGSPYIAMEYVPGPPLTRVIAALREKGQPPPVEAVVDLIAQVLLGLHALHSAIDPRTGELLQAVHRDVTPSNLIIGADFRVRLIDFGIGKSKLKAWRTRAEVIIGSPRYMAPEQVVSSDVDLRADLYSVGCVLYELLTLEQYAGEGPHWEAAQNAKFRPAAAINPSVPEALDALLKRLLAKDPEARPTSAVEILRELRAVVPATESERFSALLDELGLSVPPEDTAVGLATTQNVDIGPKTMRVDRRIFGGLVAFAFGAAFVTVMMVARWPSAPLAPAVETPSVARPAATAFVPEAEPRPVVDPEPGPPDPPEAPVEPPPRRARRRKPKRPPPVAEEKRPAPEVDELFARTERLRAAGVAEADAIWFDLSLWAKGGRSQPARAAALGALEARIEALEARAP